MCWGVGKCEGRDREFGEVWKSALGCKEGEGRCGIGRGGYNFVNRYTNSLITKLTFSLTS